MIRRGFIWLRSVCDLLEFVWLEAEVGVSVSWVTGRGKVLREIDLAN
jgi:hypothetical protein